MKLKNRTVFINGGSSGIGFEFAKQLVYKNTVIVSGRNAQKLQEIKKQYPQIVTVEFDVTKAESIVKITKWLEAKYPSLDVVINSAGQMKRIDLNDEDVELEDLTSEIDVNLTGNIRLSYALLPLLKKQGEAMLVNITSGLAWVAVEDVPVYSGTKSALDFFTRSLREQIKDSRVYVVEIAPPLTRTNLMGADTAEAKSAMSVQKLVEISLKGMRKNRKLILPGMSKALNFMGRMTPNTTTKIVGRFL